MEEKKITYHINGMTYNVTRSYKNEGGSLLERLVEYFAKHNIYEDEGKVINDESTTKTYQQNIQRSDIL